MRNPLALKNRSTGKPRRGSVLILVVSLLVMLAMMGTAYIATVRIDRANSSNAQIQLSQDSTWLDSEAGRVKQVIGDRIFGPTPAPPTLAEFRPVNKPVQYTHYTSPIYDATNQYDKYLADRLPSLNASGQPYWRYVSETGMTYTTLNGGAAYTINRATQALIPTFITLNYRAAGIDLCPMVVPALQVANADGSAPVSVVIAADADGDGIADSLLYQIPNASSPGGITYWAAVRIIDNNSAINASLAWSNQTDFTAVAGATCDALATTGAGPFNNLGTFPSHISLKELLSDPNEIGNWNTYRNGTYPSTPYLDNGNLPTPSFTWLTQGDAMFMQLGRRLANPGRYAAGVTQKYKSGVADAAYMPYRFGLIDPTQNSNPNLNPITAPASIEQNLRGPAALTSVYTSAMNWVNYANNRWTQYPANLPGYWYDYSYNFAGTALAADGYGAISGASIFGANPRVIRPLIVMSNPVSNAVQPHAYTPATPYSIPLAGYTGMSPYPSQTTPFPNPTKVSINTAPFGDLYRGFWNVMCDNATPSQPAVPAGSMFDRSVTNNTIAANDMHLLRAAVAAQNAVDMRGDFTTAVSTPTATTINIGTVPVRVFGLKPQVFIAEANIDASGKLNVVLYNPTTQAVSLTNWKLAVSSGGATADLVATLPASLGADGTYTVPALTRLGGFSGCQLLLMRPVQTAAISVDEMAPADSVKFGALGSPPYNCKRYYPGTGGTANDWRVAWPSTVALGVGAATPTAPLRAPVITVRLVDWNMPGRNKASPANQFPFGGFARDGDLLQIPFVGCYRIGASGSYTWVSVTADLSAAADLSKTYEQVGRFVPLTAADLTHGAAVDPYSWASRIFDYFTTIHNQDLDYTPGSPIGGALGNPVTPVINGTAGTANGPDEQTSSVSEGRININTAPAKVLATLPFTSVPATNLAIANAIVADRNTKGPFQTIFDLNRVVVGANSFQNAWGTFNPATYVPTNADGDFSNNPSPTAVGGEYKSRCLMLTKISNLITTRSDSFTVYVLVQAWKNAGTVGTLPQLVSQRRMAFTADRTAITPANRTLKVTQASNN